MKKFRVLKEEFKNNLSKSVKDLGGYYFFIYSFEEFKTHSDVLSRLIKEFNSEFKWDEMYTMDDVPVRFKDGCHLSILYYKDVPTGYCWFKKGWSFNLYVSKVRKRPQILPLLYINDMTQDIVDKFGYVEYETDVWNTFMIKWASKGGYKEIS